MLDLEKVVFLDSYNMDVFCYEGFLFYNNFELLVGVNEHYLESTKLLTIMVDVMVLLVFELVIRGVNSG